LPINVKDYHGDLQKTILFAKNTSFESLSVKIAPKLCIQYRATGRDEPSHHVLLLARSCDQATVSAAAAQQVMKTICVAAFCRQTQTDKHVHTGKNKKISYHRGTARRATLVNSCCVSLGMEVKQVSNCKSEIQGRSRALAVVTFDRPCRISY